VPLDDRDSRTRLIVFYVLFFMTVGITLPFMPGYFQMLGLSVTEIGFLLAVGPFFMLFMPPLWGNLADRTGRPGFVLMLLAMGSALGLAALLAATAFPAVLFALAIHSAFASSVSTVIDTLALHHVAKHGRSYSSIRIWGSAGFVAASLVFGFAVPSINHLTVAVPLGLMSLAGIWCAMTVARDPAMVHHGPRPSLFAAAQLLKSRDVALLLLATSLHWIACTPYHGSLALYVTSLGFDPSVISLSASVAVTSEILVMMTWPRWAARFSSTSVLMACFLASGLRWAIMAHTRSEFVLIAAASLHGLTFGAFYLASVEWMARRAPLSLRASGQSLYVAATYGIGGIIGYVGSGRAYDVLGGSTLFGIAAAAEVLPVLVILLASRASVEAASPASGTC
jgi:PPP family 3-phenylpropionic acid transporter